MFTLIYGCMFSGKTTKLIELYNQSGVDEENILIIKPIIDNRYIKSKISSHSGLGIPALTVKHADQIMSYAHSKIKLVFIDEIQFFGLNILQVIDQLQWQNIDVIASGLDKDYLNKNFGPMDLLKSKADKTFQLFAKCHICGLPAGYTLRTVNSNELIVIGSDDIYQPRCQKHWENP